MVFTTSPREVSSASVLRAVLAFPGNPIQQRVDYMGKKNINSKTTAPVSSENVTSPVPGEAAASASEEAKGDALRSVEEAVARAKRPAKPAVATKASSSAHGDRTGGSRKAGDPAVPAFTPDDVALRAYFIAEKRRALGLAGDEHQDWIQAEQQLIGECRPSRKSRGGQ